MASAAVKSYGSTSTSNHNEADTEPITGQPSYANETRVDESQSFYSWWMDGLGNIMGSLGSIPCFFCCPNPYQQIDQGYVGLVSRFGRVYKTTDPGLVRINPLSEELIAVDVKIQIISIPNVRITTKDNVSITLDSVIYYHIVDPYQATYGVSNLRQALVERTQTTLRGVLGTRVLQDCIENRETIANDIRIMIDIPAREWGVKVESILIKDLEFSKELQESLSSAATQKRIGESKVIAAQAEVDSAKLMREAAEILNTPAAMQIRYLETLQTMSKHGNSKIIFMPTSENAGTNPAMHAANLNNITNM
ncbi:hypothetical protein K493DRAFT_214711 [Basidiobolus meristosporus CBS 931.73]|uniref:Band 7 domain-containing protein n=1 Tax=Basidiobolus meristosporus CBS 931.73 TaxID=1314790 RepID=A0A1Y1YJG0_9FUNG|nr:hypothetical protein K493DRAFT_214711 [Basidiobolus meristosporus CBS 931.73]|eukprot:ORX98160.1 hypothetical protein K493DRAFT_214711 [Basidiobolus meristosporus CBS 931.73]